MMTIIDSITFTYVRAPLEKPVAAFGMTFSYRDYLLCELTCDDGSKGIGFSYVGVGGGRAALTAAEAAARAMEIELGRAILSAPVGGVVLRLSRPVQA